MINQNLKSRKKETESDDNTDTENLKSDSKTELQEKPDYASMEKHELIQKAETDSR